MINGTRHIPLAVIADTDANARLDLQRDRTDRRKGGANTDNRSGSHDWWYTDARLDNGANLVVVFMNERPEFWQPAEGSGNGVFRETLPHTRR